MADAWAILQGGSTVNGDAWTLLNNQAQTYLMECSNVELDAGETVIDLTAENEDVLLVAEDQILDIEVSQCEL